MAKIKQKERLEDILKSCDYDREKVNQLIKADNVVLEDASGREYSLIYEVHSGAYLGLSKKGPVFTVPCDSLYFVRVTDSDDRKPKTWEELTETWRQNNEYGIKFRQFCIQGGSKFKEEFMTYGRLIELWDHWVKNNPGAEEDTEDGFGYCAVTNAFGVTPKTRKLFAEFATTFAHEFDTIRPLIETETL